MGSLHATGRQWQRRWRQHTGRDTIITTKTAHGRHGRVVRGATDLDVMMSRCVCASLRVCMCAAVCAISVRPRRSSRAHSRYLPTRGHTRFANVRRGKSIKIVFVFFFVLLILLSGSCCCCITPDSVVADTFLTSTRTTI